MKKNMGKNTIVVVVAVLIEMIVLMMMVIMMMAMKVWVVVLRVGYYCTSHCRFGARGHSCQYDSFYSDI